MEEEKEYGMVYPLVAAISNGGRYEDNALVAGICLGEIGYQMAIKKPFISQYVFPSLIPQFDLMAMYYGYSLDHTVWEDFPDEWTQMTLVLQPRGEF